MILPPLPLANIETFSNVADFFNAHGTLTTGLVTYVGGLLLLNNLEKIRIQRGLSSTYFLRPGQFTKEDIESNWITPITIDTFIVPPSLQDLESMDSFVIGRKNDVVQKISLTPLQHINNIQGESFEWSEFYNATVYIKKCKMKVQ